MRWGIVVVAIATCAASRPAFAQSDDQRKVLARKHYQDGTRAFDLGHFEEAIKEYEEAYRNFDDPVLLYNLAQAHRLAGHAPDALRLYKVYLSRTPNAKNRVEVQTKIAALEKLIEEQRRTQNIPPDHPIRPGTTTSPGTEPPPTTTTQPAPATAQPTTAPPPSATTATTGPAQPKSERAAVPGRTKKIAGIAVAVVGLGGIGAGIGMGVLAKQASDSVTAAAKAHQPFDPAKESAGKTDQILEGVFIGVGAAALAGGVVLYYLGHREARSAGYRGIVLAPSLGPQHVGASMQVEF